MPALDRNVKVTSEKGKILVTKLNLSRHKLGCSGGALYCAKCPNFSTKSLDDLFYHVAKKHATPRVKITQQKTSENGIKMKSAEFDMISLLENDDADLKEELQACQHFLVDSELEKGRHRVVSFAMSTIDNSLINQKLGSAFKGLKCAARDNLAFDLFSKTLKMDQVDIFMLTRTIWLWRGPKLSLRQTTLPT